jgi:hypothetical protein
MKFDSKAHMAQELIAGKKFTSHLGGTIHYDPSEDLTCPFRYGDKSIGGVWELYNRDIWEEVKSHHVHQDLIDSYQEGQLWQFKGPDQKDWDSILISRPRWCPSFSYRLHPHDGLIQAHSRGVKIQEYIHGKWVESTNPSWDEDIQYRIKPNTKTVYEWMFNPKCSNNWVIISELMSEEKAERYFIENGYRKTGRSWEVEV